MADRVKKGGHGVDEDLIRKRYDRSKENLKVIAEVADNVLMFDNSKAFTQTYVEGITFSMIFVKHKRNQLKIKTNIKIIHNQSTCKIYKRFSY